MDQSSKERISLSIYFFLLGFGFASWASRIPSIKTNFDFNEAELGNLLLAMPISSLIGLPISGWLVSRFNSRVPLFFSFVVFAISLYGVGYATRLDQLVIAVSVFSFCMRIANISVNTQSLALQKLSSKKIIGSFHGLWSLGGLAGALFSTIMVKMQVPMKEHLLYVSLISLFLAVFAFPYLLKKDRSDVGNRLVFGKPDKYILYLGLMVFFAALCEGGMFDWSGPQFPCLSVHSYIFVCLSLYPSTFLSVYLYLTSS